MGNYWTRIILFLLAILTPTLQFNVSRIIEVILTPNADFAIIIEELTKGSLVSKIHY